MTEQVLHTLKSPESDEEWRSYHAIRRKVLFENRGLFGVYDEKRPDEFIEGHHPLVLLHRGESIGTIRVDIDGTRAIFRRVAVRDDLQGRGHGKAMLSLAEAFVRERKCEVIMSFVNPGAVGFYERCGFTKDDSSAPSINHVPMSKWLLQTTY